MDKEVVRIEGIDPQATKLFYIDVNVLETFVRLCYERNVLPSVYLTSCMERFIRGGG